MENHRKRVTVRSDSSAFSHALRLLLDDHQVTLVSEPAEMPPDTDLLIWQVDGDLPVDELATLASAVPTLMLAEEDQLIPAVDAGCRGFLASSASLDEVRNAVSTVLEGGAVVPPDLLGMLLHHLVQRRRHEQLDNEDLTELTDREREVFWLAADGLRKEDIGERLYMSPATARTHLQRIYRKLGVHSQSELMALGMRIRETKSEENE